MNEIPYTPPKSRGIEWSWKVDIPTVVILLGTLASSMGWAATVQAQMQRTEERLTVVERRLDALPEKVAMIEERTRSMERSLGRIEDDITRHRNRDAD